MCCRVYDLGKRLQSKAIVFWDAGLALGSCQKFFNNLETAKLRNNLRCTGKCYIRGDETCALDIRTSNIAGYIVK
jgi:hypothetical protein